MWIGLTGSPRISGVEYAGQASVEGRGVDESIVSERRGGLEVILEERFRPQGEVVWTVDELTGLALLSDIGHVCDLDLRTRADGDPSWGPEFTIRVRRTSDVEMSAPLDETDAVTGRPLLEVRFQWRSLATYTLAELGLSRGYYSIAHVDGQRTLSAHDGVTITRNPDSHPAQQVTLRDGVTVVTINTLVLGPAPTTARYASQAGSQILLKTRNTNA